MTEAKRTDALGYEEFSHRVSEGAEFAATLTCLPIGDDETGSLWQGYVKFDNDKYNWPQELPNYDGTSTIVFYQDWIYPQHKSGGAHLMNLLVNWHKEIVAFIERIRK